MPAVCPMTAGVPAAIISMTATVAHITACAVLIALPTATRGLASIKRHHKQAANNPQATHHTHSGAVARIADVMRRCSHARPLNGRLTAQMVALHASVTRACGLILVCLPSAPRKPT